jgi:YD repeat-containing protein
MATPLGRARMVRKFGTGKRAMPSLVVALSLVAVGIPDRADAVGVGSSISALSSGAVGGLTGAAADGPAVAGAEVVDKRSRFSRTFRTDDGRLTTRFSEEPVNYSADGGDSWRRVDNRLVATSGTYAARNAANAYEARLPRSLADPVVFAVGERWVSFALAGAQTPAPALSGETATYQVSPEVTARYTMHGSGVREALSLATPSAPNTFRYRIDASAGLTPGVTSAGGVAFADAGDHVRFGFSAPTLVDAKGATGQATFSLEREQSGWTLTVTADRDWLSDGARAFPVVLDPDVYWGPDAGYLRFSQADQDCYLESAAPAASTCSLPNLKVGSTPAGQQKAILRFAVEDAIPPSAQVLDARFGLVLTGRSGSPTATDLELHRLTVPWTNAATWNTTDGSQSWPSDATDPTVAGPTSEMGAPSQWYEWEPTELVQDWIARRAPNHGMVLQAAAASPQNQFEFTSSDGFATEVPYLDVKWLPAVGQVGHYTLLPAPGTETHHVKVNVANGNAQVDASDAPLAGFDEGLARSFNTLGTWFTWAENGPGWSPHLAGGLFVEVSERDGSVQVGLTDGAAMTFFPNSDGSYRSPEPDYASLHANTDGSYTVHLNDSSLTGTDYTAFEDSWAPRSATRGTSTVTVGWQTSTLRTITDSSGTTLEQHRNQDGYTTGITNQSSGRTVAYSYRPDQTLTTATTPERASDYLYDGFRGPLTSIVETPGDSIAFEYDDQGRVTTIDRTTNGTTDSMTLDYQSATAPCDPAHDAGKTTVTGADGVDVYCYDANLRVTEHDSFAPEILLGDVLWERAGGYAGVGTLPLTMSADDASPASGSGEPVSGVSSLKVLQGTTVVASASAPCSSGCPATFAQQVSVNTAALPEGMNVLSVEAADAAANTESEPLDLIVDKTAPTPPTEVHLEDFDADDETVRLDWFVGDDPDLADGEPGAGTKYTEYRRQDANNNWGEWHRFEDVSDALLANVSENETLDLEVRSIDAVGNYSTVDAVTLVAEPDEDAPAARQQVDFPCSLGLDFMRTLRQDPDYDAFIPEWTRLGAQLKLTCYVGEPRLDKVEIRGKLARYNPGSDTYTDLTPEVLVVKEMPVGATQVGTIKRKVVGFHRRCNSSMTGTRQYVVRGTVKYIYRGGTDDEDNFTTAKSTETCPSQASLIAAEHRGWSALTKKAFAPLPGDISSSSPGAHLRRSLNRSSFTPDHTPYVPEELTDVEAWTPHHIVPVSPNYASQIGVFRQVQALMFRACVHPNDALNGIFLRNKLLINRNEDGSRNPYYEELKKEDEPASKRTFHSDTRKIAYIGIVNAAFGLAVNVYDQNSHRESGDEPCNAVGLGSGVDLSTRLGGLAGLLQTGTMPLTKYPR